jgi:hypothetical protein
MPAPVPEQQKRIDKYQSPDMETEVEFVDTTPLAVDWDWKLWRSPQ